MNLPKLISDLIDAQNNRDGAAYASLFSATAVVFDEGKTYNGRTEIQEWIEKSNEAYQAVLKPISYQETDQDAILTGEVSGTFPGSPVVLNFNFLFEQGAIQSLRITG